MAELSDRRMLEIIRADGRYPVEAFAFLLNEGWPYALRKAHGEDAESSPAAAGKSKTPRHVTGRQISVALRDLAVEKWGMMAETVLKHWNIHATIDFGHMVYLLIAHHVMHKTEEDSLEDFRNVYDFSQAFARAAELELKE